LENKWEYEQCTERNEHNMITKNWAEIS
jgi:hypothetical protein